MKPFDGTYSEGSSVNAVGLLGIASTTILWTYGPKDFKGDVNGWFQNHIRMNV
jgi:hypothetical protein